MTTQSRTAGQLETGARLSPRAIGMLLVGTLSSLYVVALLLVARRAMGALVIELTWQTLLVSALVALALITGLRILWRRTFPEPTTADQWIAWGCSLTLLLIAGGMSFPGQPRDWAIWLPLLVIDQLIRRRLFEGEARIGEAPAKPLAVRGDPVQHIVRERDNSGHETVRASLRADFQAGQRHATVYVGFCPPLPRQPEFTVKPVAGAQPKIIQALPHGARIDIRLAQVAIEPTSVTINVIARS